MWSSLPVKSRPSAAANAKCGNVTFVTDCFGAKCLPGFHVPRPESVIRPGGQSGAVRGPTHKIGRYPTEWEPGSLFTRCQVPEHHVTLQRSR